MMDIGTITNIIELKAMAYDQLAAKEQVERNLAAITARIAELTRQAQVASETPPASDTSGTSP